MNAHSQPKLGTVDSYDKTLKFENPSDAECLISAAELLLPNLEVGKAIDASMLRSSREDAFGTSDTEGAWIWKDAYEAVEIAQIMMMNRYGAAMQRQAGNPSFFLEMIQKLAALTPTHTKRSEDSQKLQQFSTPLPLSAIAAEAANIQSTDVILEPSAGTGMLAIFGQIVGAKLALNELAETRSDILAGIFPVAQISSHLILSSDEYRLRVLRRVSFTVRSAASVWRSGVCLILRS